MKEHTLSFWDKVGAFIMGILIVVAVIAILFVISFKLSEKQWFYSAKYTCENSENNIKEKMSSGIFKSTKEGDELYNDIYNFARNKALDKCWTVDKDKFLIVSIRVAE